MYYYYFDRKFSSFLIEKFEKYLNNKCDTNIIFFYFNSEIKKVISKTSFNILTFNDFLEKLDIVVNNNPENIKNNKLVKEFN